MCVSLKDKRHGNADFLPLFWSLYPTCSIEKGVSVQDEGMKGNIKWNGEDREEASSGAGRAVPGWRD